MTLSNESVIKKITLLTHYHDNRTKWPQINAQVSMNVYIVLYINTNVKRSFWLPYHWLVLSEKIYDPSCSEYLLKSPWIKRSHVFFFSFLFFLLEKKCWFRNCLEYIICFSLSCHLLNQLNFAIDTKTNDNFRLQILILNVIV